MTAPITWVDCETTGLSPDRHDVWSVAAIGPDGTVTVGTWPVDLTTADRKALELNRYHATIAQDGAVKGHGSRALDLIADATVGHVLAGAAPHFDAAHLEAAMRRRGGAPAWSHRVLDVTTFAAAVMGADGPMSLKDAADMCDVPLAPDLHHGALYDVWLARQIYAVACEWRGEVPDGWVDLTWDRTVEAANANGLGGF